MDFSVLATVFGKKPGSQLVLPMTDRAAAATWLITRDTHSEPIFRWRFHVLVFLFRVISSE